MQVEYLSKLQPEFAVTPNGHDHWILVEPFQFSVDGVSFTVPTGFWTDFASVPRILWPIISPYDLGVGCIPHDFGYYCGPGTREFWDSVFLACMRKDGITAWKRFAAYQAVRRFGKPIWDSHRSQSLRSIRAPVEAVPKATIPAAAQSWLLVLRAQTGT